MILTRASTASDFAPLFGNESIVFKAFITNEPKVVISGIFHMLMFMMMILESKEMKIRNMSYDHRAINEESYVWPR